VFTGDSSRPYITILNFLSSVEAGFGAASCTLEIAVGFGGTLGS